MGAGAMIPFGGPTTNELTESLSHYKYYKNVLERLKCKKYKNVNFENILANIEQLLEWKKTKVYHENNLTSIELLEPIYAYTQTLTIDIQNEYYGAINEIIERIKRYDHYSQCDEIIKKRNSLADFLKAINRDRSIKIYSLNYDRIIPQLFKSESVIYEGATNGVYEYDYMKFLNHRFTYFNLHGSIYLDYIPGRKMRISNIPVDYYHSYSLPGGNPGEMKPFTPIIVGHSKTQRILSEPFNFGIGAFMYDCNTCDNLIVIGYSFGDPYINNIIRNFTNKNYYDISIVDYSMSASLPVNIPIHEVNLTQKSFEEQEKGGFYSSIHRAHLYLNGFYDYIDMIISEHKAK